jgi:hypothetical protein
LIEIAKEKPIFTVESCKLLALFAMHIEKVSHSAGRYFSRACLENLSRQGN